MLSACLTLSLSHSFHIAPVITGGGYSPGTVPSVTVRESDGLARVCVKLSGIVNPSLSAPVNFTFTPTQKDGAISPAQSKFNYYIYKIRRQKGYPLSPHSCDL